MTAKTWARIALFNLLLVACLGLLMRLKMLFPLPWIDQRFTLHAHSHFAFSGWISHALLLSVAVAVLGAKFDGILPRRYNRLLAFNLFCAYGMLVSFLLQGYAAVSITFSTLSILTGFVFYGFCQKEVDLSMRKEVWWKYIHAALIFNILSCMGTFLLAWTMVWQPANTPLRLASVYFYLHFQYNGWFFFACMGLFYHWLYQQNFYLPNTLIQFRLFAMSCVPVYLLSINWMTFPNLLHVFSVLTALVQLAAFGSFAMMIWQSREKIMQRLPSIAQLLLVAVFIAMSIKFLLQTASSLPAIAHLAFGLRPVVIAYLHLVLLGIVTLFLICLFYTHNVIKRGATTHIGIGIFVFGVVLNEFFLMIQGIGSLSGIYVSHLPELLAIVSVILAVGVAVLLSARADGNN